MLKLDLLCILLALSTESTQFEPYTVVLMSHHMPSMNLLSGKIAKPKRKLQKMYKDDEKHDLSVLSDVSPLFYTVIFQQR